MNIVELAILSKLLKVSGKNEDKTFTPGLYQTGAIALYQEQGEDAIKDMLITSWDELIASGAMRVDNGEVSMGAVRPDNLPEKNKYGFYYGVKYAYWDSALEFYEDGSIKEYDGDAVSNVYPPNTATYSANNIYYSDEWGWRLDFIVSSDGLVLTGNDGYRKIVGSKYLAEGDMIMPNDGSITAISMAAFSTQENNLTGVSIPDSVTSIGEEAFDSCEGLESLTIGNSVTNIEDSAFSNCTNLISINIPDSVTSIGSFAFGNCSSLTSVNIPNSVNRIEGSTFDGCTSLTSVTIPDSVTSIGEGAFGGCTNLANVYYAGTEEQWNAITIGAYNESLANATIHYNYQG